MNIFCWILAFIIGYLVIYGLNLPEVFAKNLPPKAALDIYGGFHRLAWGVVVSWVIFACCRGYGGNDQKLCELFITEKELFNTQTLYCSKLMKEITTWSEFVTGKKYLAVPHAYPFHHGSCFLCWEVVNCAHLRYCTCVSVTKFVLPNFGNFWNQSSRKNVENRDIYLVWGRERLGKIR